MSMVEKIKLANHEIDEYQKLSGSAAGQANETLRFLSGQLILIAATIITISAAFIASDYDGQPLDIFSKQLLTAAWIILTLSISFGIADIIITARFFTRWQIYHHKMAESLSVSDYQSSIDAILQVTRNQLAPLKPKSESPHWPLYTQVGCLTLGLLLFLVLIIKLLFTSTP